MKLLHAYCLRLHRWFGLVAAVFLVLVGLSGSLLVFYEDLDSWVNPQFLAPIRADAPPLDLASLAERAQALAPEAQVVEATWRNAGRQAEIRTRPWPGAAAVPLGFDSILLDPVTGTELGRRTWGDIHQGRVNLIPFIYRLHYELAMGDAGALVLGVVALAWTIDCFVGLILTLPLTARPSQGAERRNKSFWSRWGVAWRIKPAASGIRRLFDLHRAFGVWCWAAGLIFAWSGVYLNLPQVYEPIMAAVTGYQPANMEMDDPESAMTHSGPSMSWPQALQHARRLMAEEAQKHGIVMDKEVMLRFVPDQGLWLYRTHTNRDILERRGATDLYFDANTGVLHDLQLPTGGGVGITITNWLYALHTANVWGWPWRIAVTALGLVLTMVSVTGVLIWLCKRRLASRIRSSWH